MERSRPIIKPVTWSVNDLLNLINSFINIKYPSLKKSRSYILILLLSIVVYSCTKEYSLENGGNINTDGLIVGIDCRISKIDSHDSASGVALSSIIATINSRDTVTDITHIDSLGNNLLFNSMPFYAADTIFIDPDEYFIVDLATKKIINLHGIINSIFPPVEFNVDYLYNTAGNLVQKNYHIPGFFIDPVIVVDYTYLGGNLTHMTSTDMTASELITDADIDYYTNIKPKNYMNLQPDEGDQTDFNHFAGYTQFFNFGTKPLNAVKKMIVRYYSGNVAVDSSVSTFNTYIMSRDGYVMNVYMLGDDQPSIPAEAGKLKFSYKCK